MARGWNTHDPARVLVTGCSSGIGKALCADLHERGHQVIATARDLGSIADVAAAVRLQLDVTLPDSVAAAAAAAGAVDVLVNNAGVTAWAPLEQMPIETAQRVFEANVWGAVRMSQALLPAMRARGRGRIVNVSSAAALRAYPMLGLYAASKAALESLSESTRLEVAAFGVDVVLAEPAAVVTKFGANRITVEPTNGDYDDLTERAFRFLQSLRGTTLSSEETATAIADMIEADDPPLRIPVGDDARRLSAERRVVTDEEFEHEVLKGIGVPGETPRTPAAQP